MVHKKSVMVQLKNCLQIQVHVAYIKVYKYRLTQTYKDKHYLV